MRKSVEILRDSLEEHPAVKAWGANRPKRVEPELIGVIKAWKGGHKSGVYRLAGVGPRGSAVIAKRCPLGTAALERQIYEEFLPCLPVPTLDYYGSVLEPDGQSCWLFMEEATGDLYSPQDQEHRALAALWLAATHHAARGQGWETRLPSRGPKQYLQLLHTCRATLREYVGNPNLPPDGPAVLETLADQCDLLEEHWGELEEICGAIPHALIHGDFVMRNLVVRPSAAGPQLLVFDWEFAGWGAPAVDLAQHIDRVASPDLAVYRSCSEECLGDSETRRLAECGGFFRLLDSIHWTCVGLLPGPPLFLIKPISVLESYSRSMAQALRGAGWTSHD